MTLTTCKRCKSDTHTVGCSRCEARASIRQYGERIAAWKASPEGIEYAAWLATARMVRP